MSAAILDSLMVDTAGSIAGPYLYPDYLLRDTTGAHDPKSKQARGEAVSQTSCSFAQFSAFFPASFRVKLRVSIWKQVLTDQMQSFARRIVLLKRQKATWFAVNFNFYLFFPISLVILM